MGKDSINYLERAEFLVSTWRLAGVAEMVQEFVLGDPDVTSLIGEDFSDDIILATNWAGRTTRSGYGSPMCRCIEDVLRKKTNLLFERSGFKRGGDGLRLTTPPLSFSAHVHRPAGCQARLVVNYVVRAEKFMVNKALYDERPEQQRPDRPKGSKPRSAGRNGKRGRKRSG